MRAKRLISPLVSAVILAASFYPSLAPVAQASSYKAMHQAEQDATKWAESQQVNPYSDDTKTLLSALGITLQPVDPLWQDPAFSDFMNTYKAYIAYAQNGDYANTLLTYFDLEDKGLALHREEFDMVFLYASLTAEERQTYQEFKDFILARKAQFAQDYQSVLNEWFDQAFQDAQEQYQADVAEHPLDYVVAYADRPIGEWYLTPGRLTWLRVYNENVVSGLTATWVQTGGTPVQWMKTDSATDAAFFVPSIDQTSDTLTFAVTLSDGKQTVTQTVSVLVYTDDPLSRIYLEELQRSPDPSGYDFWSKEHAKGASFDEIRAKFRQSDEYQRLHSFDL